MLNASAENRRNTNIRLPSIHVYRIYNITSSANKIYTAIITILYMLTVPVRLRLVNEWNTLNTTVHETKVELMVCTHSYSFFSHQLYTNYLFLENVCITLIFFIFMKCLPCKTWAAINLHKYPILNCAHTLVCSIFFTTYFNILHS